MFARVASIILLLVVVLGVVVVARTLSLTSTSAAVAPFDAVRVDAGAAARRLAEGLRFRTISHENRANTETDQFLALHAHLERSYPLAHQHLHRELVSDLTLLYTWEGRNSDLRPGLLMAHLDVVPVDEADWDHAPFGGEIVDGVIWGRGAIDDKAALYAILEAVELLLAEGFQPERTMYLSFGHDEEVGGPAGAGAVVDLLEERGVELDYTLDEGGFIIENALPGVDKPVAMVGIAEKGFLTLTLRVETTGGHSSIPPRHGSIGIVSAAITRLEANPVPGGIDELTRNTLETLAPELPFGVRAVLANLWLFGGVTEMVLASNPTMDAMLRTTTAVTMMHAGVKANVLPVKAEATVNFRVRPGDTVEGVVAHVRDVIDDDRIEILGAENGREASPISRTDSPGFERIARTIRQVFPEAPVVPYVLVAGTDSKHFYRITDNIYRFNPFVFDRNSATLAHGTNERVGVDNFAKGVVFYAQLIRN